MLKEDLLPGKTSNSTVFWGIYNKIIPPDHIDGVDDVETVGLIKILAREGYGFSDQYKTGLWHLIEGGQLEIYQGTKVIKLTAATKMKETKKQGPPPNLESLLFSKYCETSFKEIIGIPDDRIPMLSACGWLLGFDMNANYLHIHLVDKYQRRISIRDWTATAVPDQKLGYKVIVSKFRKTPVFEKIELTAYGPIIYLDDEKHRFKNMEELQDVIEDLSTVDYDEEFEYAKSLTIQEVMKGVVEGGYGSNSFYRLDNVVIKAVASFFKIRDKHKQIVTAGWDKGMVVDAK